MGKYLNPKDKPKEIWLFDNGLMVPNPKLLESLGSGMSLEMLANDIIDDLGCAAIKELTGVDNNAILLATPQKDRDDAFFGKYVIVDMVNNGGFRAAAVYTNRAECLMIYGDYEKMLEGDDRQRIWFIVDREKALAEVRDMFDKK